MNARSLFVAAFTGLQVLACLPAAADPFDRTRALIADVMNEESLPSLSVAVAKDGRIVWEQAFGWADVERRIPATTATMYSLASVTKPVTTTALMTLVERGVVDLDRPANDYLGGAALTAHVGDVRDATVRRVANHTAGLPIHYQFFYEDEDREAPPMPERIALHGHLVSAPGESFVYSNFGYGVLDHLIATMSGKSYAEYLQAAVFEPLGLTRMAVDARSDGTANVAVRYGANREPLPFYGFSAPGASAVFSSAADLARFGMFHLGDLHRASPGKAQVLGLDSLREMLRPAEYADRPADAKRGYGLGWSVGRFHGVEAVYHTGSMAGVSSVLALLPEHDLALALLVNADSRRMDDIERSIVEVLVPAAKAANREFRPEPELVGDWRGQVLLPRGPLPVAMHVDADGRVTVAIDGRAPVEAGAVESIEGKLWVEYVPERFDLPELERLPTELQFGLRQRDGKLRGEATTMTRPLPDRVGDAISFYVELARAPAS